jgi:Holliday junction DNA helicase RuvA
MIRLLSGTLVAVDIGSVVIDVHGVGYLVYMSSTSHVRLGEETTLHTYLSVRENALDLFGFTDAFALESFSMLLTVPQIGPKSALGVLATTPPALLAEAVVANNPHQLQTLGGVGKKTAERIVQQLHGRWQPTQVVEQVSVGVLPIHTEAVEALITLGYERTRVVTFLREQELEGQSLSDIIRHALRVL